MTNRFLKLRELGSKGKKSNPLILDEFQWDSEWVDANCEAVHQGVAAADFNWGHVDEATGATQGLRGRNLPRAAAAAPNYVGRKRKNPTAPVDDQDLDIDMEEQEELIADDVMEEHEDDEANMSMSRSGASEDGVLQEPTFQLDDALFDG